MHLVTCIPLYQYVYIDRGRVLSLGHMHSGDVHPFASALHFDRSGMLCYVRFYPPPGSSVFGLAVVHLVISIPSSQSVYFERSRVL